MKGPEETKSNERRADSCWINNSLTRSPRPSRYLKGAQVSTRKTHTRSAGHLSSFCQNSLGPDKQRKVHLAVVTQRWDSTYALDYRPS